jgi:hypothetical protein
MYSPKISPEIIRKLFSLKEELAGKGIKKPITVLVREESSPTQDEPEMCL